MSYIIRDVSRYTYLVDNKITFHNFISHDRFSWVFCNQVKQYTIPFIMSHTLHIDGYRRVIEHVLNNMSSVSLHSRCRQISHGIVFRIKIATRFHDHSVRYITCLTIPEYLVFCLFFSDCRHMPVCACLCLYLLIPRAGL